MGVNVKLSWTNASITIDTQEVQLKDTDGSWLTLVSLSGRGHTAGGSYEYLHEIISGEATINEYRIVTIDAEGVEYIGNVVTQEIPASIVPVDDLTSEIVIEPIEPDEPR